MKRSILALIAVAGVTVHPASAQDAGRPPGDGGASPSFYGLSLQTPNARRAQTLRGCVVQKVKLVASGNTDTPLIDPLPYSAPRPGTSNTSQQGPVNGPEPNSNPATIFSGYAFEYHSQANRVKEYVTKP